MSAVTSVLSDGTIRRLVDEKQLVITPWDEKMLQPASVDLKLGPSIRVFNNHHLSSIDIADPPKTITQEIKLGSNDAFVLHPGEFVLGSTIEWVEIPDNIVAHIEGKSSLGRLGLIVHATAGFVDPGFHGELTLEITNLARIPIVLRPRRPIAQLSFMTLDKPAEKPYGHPELGSHYQDQRDATEARHN